MAKSNRGRKPHSRSQKPKDYKDKFMDDKSNQDAPIRNNANMYFTDALLAEQVSNFSFSQFGGAAVLPYGPTELNSVKLPKQNAISYPSVMALRVNPSPGYCEGSINDAINMQALKTYTALSNSNAKTTLYAPQDVTTLILAVGEVVSMIEHLRRILATGLTFNPRNWSFPKQFIEAMGVDPDDVLRNLAQYRMALNTQINRFNAIPIPNNITYLTEKCFEIYRHIYSDSESPMASYYIFTPYSTWELNEDEYEEGTILKTRMLVDHATSTFQWDLNWHKETQKFTDLLNILTNQITSLLSSSTFNVIYADIMRLSTPRLQTELMSENYVVMPEYNPMILLQIHNSYAYGAPRWNAFDEHYTPMNDVYPLVGAEGELNKANSIIYKPNFQDGKVYMLGGVNAQIIDFPHSMGNPDVDQRVDVTRYKILPKGHLALDGEGLPYLELEAITIPDHYVVDYVLFEGNSPIESLGYCKIRFTSAYVFNDDNLGMHGLTAREFAQVLWDISRFDFAPTLYRTHLYSNDWINGVDSGVANTDVDFFTGIDFRYLDQVNELTLMGLFAFR